MTEYFRARPGLLKLVLAFAAVYVIWGSTYLAIRVALETMPPFLMAGSRFLIAGSILYGWSRWRGDPRPTLVNWKASLLIGGLLLLGGNGAVVWAEQYIPSSQAALLIASEPLMVVLLQGIIPRGWLLAGLTLGFSGLVLLIGPEKIFNGEHASLFGALAVLGGCMSWALGSLKARTAKLPAAPLASTALQMLAGGALLTLAGTLHGEWAIFHPAAFSLRSLLATLYLILFGSIVAFSAYGWLVRNVSPSKVSTYAYVNPVIAVLIGWGLGGEALTARMGIAAVVIIGAVLIINTKVVEPAIRKEPQPGNKGGTVEHAAPAPAVAMNPAIAASACDCAG